MGAVVNNLEKGGGETKGVGDVLQGGGAGSTSLWVGDVGDDPRTGGVIGGSQHRVAICITGMYPLGFLDGSW